MATPAVEEQRRGLGAVLDRPLIRKLFKYSMTSVVGVVVTQTALLVMVSLFDWSAFWSNIAAVALGTIPTFEMSKRWVWQKEGKANLKTEIVPFWILTFLGLVLSSIFVVFFENHWPENKLLINLGNILGFGLLWVVKFVILDRVLFKTHEHHVPIL